MNIGKIISNSFKYPFRNIKKLPILFFLFILFALVPIGLIYDNKYALILGMIAFFAFILIVPGYLFSMVSIGLNESSMFPSLNFGKNIYDSLRLWALRIAYMFVPVCVFFIVVSTMGVSSIEMLYRMDILGFIVTAGLSFIIVILAYLIFEFLLFFAKARMAYLNSLGEALKIHKVIIDIKNIGIFNIIKWIVFMVMLAVVVSYLSSLLMMIPYAGFLIYLGVVIPILESIGNYSLGLLYSNIAGNGKNPVRIAQNLR